MSWSDDKELTSRADIISWKSLKKKTIIILILIYKRILKKRMQHTGPITSFKMKTWNIFIMCYGHIHLWRTLNEMFNIRGSTVVHIKLYIYNCINCILVASGCEEFSLWKRWIEHGTVVPFMEGECVPCDNTVIARLGVFSFWVLGNTKWIYTGCPLSRMDDLTKN